MNLSFFASLRRSQAHPLAVIAALAGLLLATAPLRAHDSEIASGHAHIRSLSVLADNAGVLDAERVRQRGQQGDFAALDGAFNKGYTDSNWWLRFTLEPAHRDAGFTLLEFGPAYLDDVQLYYLHEGRLQLLGHQGDHQPFADREPPWRQSLFRLPEEIWSAGIVYARIQSSSAVAADITLWRDAPFLQHAGHEILFYALIASLGTLLSLTSLVLWRLLKQQNFLCFGVYMFSLTAVGLLFEGMLHYLLLPRRGLALEGLQVALQAVVVISMAKLFLGILVGNQARSPSLQRLSWVLAGLPLAATLPALLGHSGRSIQLLWLLFAAYFICFGVIMLVRNWRNSQRSDPEVRRSDWLYGIAFCSISVPVVIRMYVIFGFSEPGLISNAIILISMVLYIFLLYIALITHYSESVADLSQAEASALAAIIESEQRLDAEVKQRTTELGESQQLLKQQLLESEQQRSELNTIRERLDQALDAERAASEAHGDFLRLVAHEFRTPLSVIDTACSLLDQQAIDARLEANLQRIRQASKNMGQLVDQALTEDKLNIAAWRCNSAWLSLADLLASSVEHGRSHAQGRQRIILQVFHHATVQGDPDMLRLMFNNLIDNAIKYSPDDSTIHVRLDSTLVNQPRVSVSDQGPGINPAEHLRIAEKFFRGAEARHRSGLGLGLYLVNRAANLHQAVFSIDNLPQGGSCASIIFPATAMEVSG